MDPAQLARIQAENAELRQKVAKAREERDAAILLCRQYHEQMLQNSHVFGLLSLVFEEEPGTAAQGPAAAAQQQDMQE
jgi:DNA-binding GntR family transcriptional regulator